jgi:hypothetical protein
MQSTGIYQYKLNGVRKVKDGRNKNEVGCQREKTLPEK